jgi:hypothetical protein
LDTGWKDDRQASSGRILFDDEIAVIDSSIAEWIAGRVSRNIQMCPRAEKICDNFCTFVL